jgi:hypothetical protein
MNNGATKVTVVIPTRCRPDTLAKSLQTAIHQDYPNLEIIVSDNFSEDDTEAVVRSANDPRIRYLNTGRRISMADNFEFAISHIKEGWIILIGDDDGLVHNSLSRVIPRLEQSGLKALASRSCFYRWPNRRPGGCTILSVPMRKRYEIRSGRVQVRKALRDDIGFPDLPMLYTGGIVHVSVINQMRDNFGKFFHSQFPDCYSSVAIAAFLDHYVFSYEPFAISGASHHSSSLAWTGQSGGSASAALYNAEPNIALHKLVPADINGSLPQSVAAMVYEAYLKSEYLHHDFARVQPVRQLQVYLATGGVSGADLTPWCRRFAEHHGIDFDALALSVSTRAVKLRHRIVKGLGLLENVLERYRIANDDAFRMDDVNAASVIAAEILTSRKNRIGNLGRFASRKLGGHLGAKIDAV